MRFPLRQTDQMTELPDIRLDLGDGLLVDALGPDDTPALLAAVNDDNDQELASSSEIIRW